MSGTSPHTPSQNLNEMNQFPEIFKKIKKVKPPGKNPQKGPGAPPPPKKRFYQNV